METLAGNGISDVLESKHNQVKQSKVFLNLPKNQFGGTI